MVSEVQGTRISNIKTKHYTYTMVLQVTDFVKMTIKTKINMKIKMKIKMKIRNENQYENQYLTNMKINMKMKIKMNYTIAYLLITSSVAPKDTGPRLGNFL